MSSYSDYANAVGNILTHQGDVAARAKEQSGQIWGNTLATLGDVVPKEVQQVLKDRAAKQKTAQIQGIIQQNGGDLDRALPMIMGVDATIGAKLADEHAKVQKSIADVQKIQDDAKKAQLEYSDRLWGQVNDEGTYAHAAMVDKALGGQPLDHYDPDWVKQKKQSLLSLKDQLDANKPMVVGTDLVSPQGNVIYSGDKKPVPIETTNEAGQRVTKFVSPEAGVEVPKPPAEMTPFQTEEMKLNTQRENREASQGATRLQIEQYRATHPASAATVNVQTGLNDEALNQAADKFYETGILPSSGMGAQAAADKRAIMNRAAERHAGATLAANSAEYKANSASLSKIQVQRDAVVSFEKTANQNLDRFLETAKGVVDSGSPLINSPLRAVANTAFGSSNQAAFNAARLVAQNEIAKVTSNPNLTGQLSDSARKEMETAISPNATLKQIYAAAAVLRADMGSRRSSLDDQIAEIQGRLGGKPATTGVPKVGDTFQGGKVLKVTPVP